MENKANFKYALLSLFIVAGGAILISRLYFVQITKGDYYTAIAEKQYTKKINNLDVGRGNIFFLRKDGTLFTSATTLSGYSVFINTSINPEIEEVVAKINEKTKIDTEIAEKQKNSANGKKIRLLSRIDDNTKNAIADLKIEGLTFEREQWRFYPAGNLSGQTLGFFGNDGEKMTGRYGLEQYYDYLLSKETKTVSRNLFAELFDKMKFTKNNRDTEGAGQASIVATIEPTVEVYVDKELRKIFEEHKSSEVGAVVMDPSTGEIYSLSHIPNYDPNKYGSVSDISLFKNPLVENMYEMGSIIKPLTISAGIESGAISSDSTYYDEGYLKIDDRVISNVDKKNRGLTTIKEILSESLNVGAVYVMKKTGTKKFAEKMFEFGMGVETGVDLPNEASGLVGNSSKAGEIGYATASFGQGISLTPISTIRALSVIANGGYLVTPHLIKKIIYEDGKEDIASYEEQKKRVLSRTTTEDVTRMLVYAVDNRLNDGKQKISKYSVAAKTGTAQIPKTGEGGYYDDRLLHSFFGYFPAYNPKFIILIYAIDPKGSQYSSQTLATPFFSIAKFLISYYDIAPDR